MHPVTRSSPLLGRSPPVYRLQRRRPSGGRRRRGLATRTARGRRRTAARRLPARRARRAARCDAHRPPHVHALDEAEHGEPHDQAGAAVGDERQRQAGDREQLHRHADVLDDLPHEHREHAGADVRAEAVPRQVGDAPDAQQGDAEQAEQHGAADEAELLADGGEREVGPQHGDVGVVGERPVEPSLAEQPAGAEGLQGEVHLVAPPDRRGRGCSRRTARARARAGSR